MRFVFYGIIILICILAILLVGQLIYWCSRIFVCRHTAWTIHWSALAIITTVAVVASIWGHYITRYQVNINQVKIVSEHVPTAFNGYKIAHISDLHLDCFNDEKGHAFLTNLIDSIRSQHPDIIVFTGDIVTGQSAEAEPFRQELAKLAEVTTVYSILGNHDYADYTRMSPRQKHADVENLCSIQREAGWHLLLNESAALTKGQNVSTTESHSDSILLVGVENIGEPPFSTYGDLTKAMSSYKGEFCILLSHNPTHWRKEVLPDTDIDLMLAGHTHAVQLKVGNWSPAKWKYAEWSGLYSSTQKSHPQYLYVNTGIGGVGPRVRIGIAPELTILTLSNPSILR